MVMPLMPLMRWMREHDHVAHSSTLRAAGFSAHEVKEAVRHGQLRRVRRSWLVTSEVSPERLAAASVGGRATCVSAAAARGLWTPARGVDAFHVAVPHSASRIQTDGILVHRATGPAPVASRATVEPLINVLFHVARCLEPADALAVWESALRLRVTDSDELSRVVWRSRRAAEIAATADSLSDSGLESHFIALMRLIGVTVTQQVWIDGHPVDALIGERLVIQLDGFAHHQARDRRRDIAADARLTLRGYTVLRFDYHQVLFQPETVQQTVLTAIAQGLHLGRRSA